MGQQSLLTLTQDNYIFKFEKELKKQADLLYLKEKFALETEYSKNKTMHAYLMIETLDNCECEISNWIHLKLLGMLENVKLDKKKNKLIPLKFSAVQIINQTFNNGGLDQWQSLGW